MNDYKEPKIAVIIDSVEHQGIGGKEIVIEKEGTLSYILDKTFTDMTIAEIQFAKRYDIANKDENTKLYYGHVDGLGYFVAEDELKEGTLRAITWREVFGYV